MSLRQLSRTWNAFGRQDPLWAILSHRDKRGNRWDLAEFLQTGREEIDDALAYARQHQPELQLQSALDFGCGVGRLTQALAEHFETVDGVDIAVSMLERAEAINTHGDRCRYHLNAGRDLQRFRDQQFDFVYSNLTLQHMPQSLAHGYILELCRVLRPGGALVFQLPVQPKRSRSRLGALLSWGLRGCQLAWLRHLRRQPVMDMFGTAPEQIEALVGAAGCVLADSSESAAAGPDWWCRRYCAIRLR